MPGDRSAAMAVEVWPIGRIQAYESNARRIPRAAVDKVAASLREFGWQQPIVVDGAGVIVVGHVRRLAAIQNGWSEAPVHVALNLTPEQVKAYRLMDNRSHEETSWDRELVGTELLDLKGIEAFDLLLTGFDLPEISKMTAPGGGGGGGLAGADPDGVPATPESEAQVVTRPGEAWLLGSHRLVCADSRDLRNVQRLMQNDQAELVFTDPPYGISIVRATDGIVSGFQRKRNADAKAAAGKGKTGNSKPFGKNGFDSVIEANTYPTIIGDDSIETAVAGYRMANALKPKTIILWGGNFYAHRLPPAKCWIVWDKEQEGNFGDGEIAWCSADKSIRIFRHKWSGMLKASERNQRRVHPTQKPVALAEWAFAEFASDQKVVVDLFLGSGSTLIACEKSGRQCLGMELSPAYCDVIVKRWQEFTGRRATLETGGTFADIAAERLPSSPEEVTVT